MPRGNHSKQVTAEYGGFHDLPTFRAESGLTEADISDVDALNVINEDIREQKRIADLERGKAQQERDRIRAENESTKASKNDVERALEAERATRRLTNGILTPFGSPSTLADYYAKERLKQEVKDDLMREQRLRRYDIEREKELAKIWKPERKPRAKSKPKPRAKSKSKPRSNSRSKTKNKTNSKSKSKK